MRDSGFRVTEVNHVNIAADLAHDQYVVLDVHERCDIWSLCSDLTYLLEILCLVDKCHATVTCQSHSLGPLRNHNLIDAEAFID